MINLTYNSELEMSSESLNEMTSLLEEQRDIVNFTSEIISKNKLTRLSIKFVHDLCYKEIKKQFPNALSQVIIKAQQEILANLKAIKSNKHKNHNQIQKHNLSLRLDKRLYSNLTQKSIKISLGHGRTEVQFKMYDKLQEMFDKGSPCDPLIFIRNGKPYISLTFQLNTPTIKDDSTLGVDLGMRRLYTTSDGVSLKGTEFLKHKRRIRYNKRMLQKTNTKSSKRKLKKLKSKEANFSENYIHHVANEILKTNKSIVVMEDLTKIKTKKHKNQNLNAKSQIAFYMLKEILTYKALLKGKKVETVNPAYTSQDDCRGQSRGERKGCRYIAVDGIVLDADWNASINIAKRFDHNHPIPLIPLDGGLNQVGRLLSTSQKLEL